jgi:multidrug efflux pump subunit AcrB
MADIFPDIRVPVIAVAWQYAGLPPRDGRPHHHPL